MESSQATPTTELDLDQFDEHLRETVLQERRIAAISSWCCNQDDTSRALMQASAVAQQNAPRYQ